ncbi:MAG: hypothetical protein OHK005_02730 [Candidatus Methylacidiphilales bacterium]
MAEEHNFKVVRGLRRFLTSTLGLRALRNFFAALFKLNDRRGWEDRVRLYRYQKEGDTGGSMGRLEERTS